MAYLLIGGCFAACAIVSFARTVNVWVGIGAWLGVMLVTSLVVLYRPVSVLSEAKIWGSGEFRGAWLTYAALCSTGVGIYSVAMLGKEIVKELAPFGIEPNTNRDVVEAILLGLEAKKAILALHRKGKSAVLGHLAEDADTYEWQESQPVLKKASVSDEALKEPTLSASTSRKPIQGFWQLAFTPPLLFILMLFTFSMVMGNFDKWAPLAFWLLSSTIAGLTLLFMPVKAIAEAREWTRWQACLTLLLFVAAGVTCYGAALLPILMWLVLNALKRVGIGFSDLLFSWKRIELVLRNLQSAPAVFDTQTSAQTRDNGESSDDAARSD